MQRYALINNLNIVENIISWDGISEWTSPINIICLNVENIECGIGWTYNGTTFIQPEEIVQEVLLKPTKEELIAQINALSAQIQELT